MFKSGGLRTFSIIWLGQIVSVIGSGMTQFALTVWAYEKTGLATVLALVGTFYFVPLIAISPVAGALSDRWSRKTSLLISDIGAFVATTFLLLLFSLGRLEIWHIYISAFVTGATQSFQWPAISAMISTMIPKDQYGRANGLMGLLESVPGVFAPIVGAILYASVGLGNILWIDVISFSAAIAAILWVKIPKPLESEAGKESKGSLFQESLFGFKYIWSRKSLLGLQLTFFFLNLGFTASFTVLPAMILARTHNHEATLGFVQSVGGIGGIIGGIALATWGGPKRKIHGILIGMISSSLLGPVLQGFGTVMWIWALASFIEGFTVPFLNGSSQALWQAKVPPDIQGKVFASRRMIAWFANPIATLIGGVSADRFFEPSMKNGFLGEKLGWVFGTTAGSGMGFLMVLGGLLGATVGIVGYLNPWIRNAESILPDHDEVA